MRRGRAGKVQGNVLLCQIVSGGINALASGGRVDGSERGPMNEKSNGPGNINKWIQMAARLNTHQTAKVIKQKVMKQVVRFFLFISNDTMLGISFPVQDQATTKN
jgi:hypothetical protein